VPYNPTSSSCVGIPAGTGGRAGSKAAEMQRFLAKLTNIARRKGQNMFTRGELRAVATEINLKVHLYGGLAWWAREVRLH